MKNNSPGPLTYDAASSLDKMKLKKSFEFLIPKHKNKNFLDEAQRLAKELPGVGKYDFHLALDKVSRPMKKYR